ncbi:hypothetical protein JOF53_003063 [Crossiella equi]|uniref:Lipoprotein n=1 Tax=Crossiella equi TaxID=130796 RepID=A0ABS5AC86_9PSEU|nr:hypothetical protein [Crossiella equi]MBP2474191.1 hypothetical protein [Crossiella equi]
MSALLAGTAACGGGGVALDNDIELGNAIHAVAEEGRTTTLMELAGGDWDQVQMFRTESASKQRIERTLGEEVDMPGIFMGKETLLFFKKGGKVVRAVKVTPNLTEGLFGAGVVVDGTDHRLLVREPEGG